MIYKIVGGVPELVTTEFLIEKFDIPVPNKKASFKLLGGAGGSITVNPRVQDGRPMIPAGINVPRYMVLKKGGEQFAVQFCDAPPQINDKGERSFGTTRADDFRGAKKEFILPDDLERYVQFYLSPLHKKSPIAGRNCTRYELVDNKENAKKEAIKNETLLEALNLVNDYFVWEEDEKVAKMSEARLKAKGFNIGDVDLKSKVELLAAFQNRAIANPVQFIEDWNNLGLRYEGFIYDGIDKGILVMKHDGTIQKWYWEKGDLAGSEICVVESSQNPRAKLVKEFHKRVQDYLQPLRDAVVGTTVRETSTKHLQEAFAEEDIITKSLKAGVIKEEGGNFVFAGSKKVAFEGDRAEYIKYLNDNKQATTTLKRLIARKEE